MSDVARDSGGQSADGDPGAGIAESVEAQGARVAVFDPRSEDSLDAAAMALKVKVAVVEAVEAAFVQVVEKLGRPDLGVGSAGIDIESGAAEESLADLRPFEPSLT